MMDLQVNVWALVVSKVVLPVIFTFFWVQLSVFARAKNRPLFLKRPLYSDFIYQLYQGADFENVHAICRPAYTADKAGIASKGGKKSEKVPFMVTLVGKYVGH